MKRKITIPESIIICALVLVVITTFWPKHKAQAAPPAAATKETELVCSTGRSANVSGTAVVNVTPDRVLIQLGVQSNDTTPQLVEAANSKTINQVIKDLKKLGIEEKDIVTDWYVIDPIYHNYDSLRIKGYRINNVIAITLRDISIVNEVIVTSLEAGANEVINVEFYLSDLRKYRDQARDLAMVAAKEKAQDLASAAGAEVGCVMSINENTWSYYNGWWYGRYNNSNLWTQNVVQNVQTGSGESALSDSGPVNLGQIAVKAEVSASFSLN